MLLYFKKLGTFANQNFYLSQALKQLYLKSAVVGMRGGGVGFYIKNNFNAKIIDILSPIENNIIESLTIQLTYPTKNL